MHKLLNVFPVKPCPGKQLVNVYIFAVNIEQIMFDEIQLIIARDDVRHSRLNVWNHSTQLDNADFMRVLKHVGNKPAYVRLPFLTYLLTSASFNYKERSEKDKYLCTGNS